MDAQMREYFLRELMILQNNNNITEEQEQQEQQEQQQQQDKEVESNINIGGDQDNEIKSTTTTNKNKKKREVKQLDNHQQLHYCQNRNKRDLDKTKEDKLGRTLVNVTFFSDSGTTGRTLSGSFVACDTNLTHILLNDLITPIGLQSSALLRLNDVIAISYC